MLIKEDDGDLIFCIDNVEWRCNRNHRDNFDAIIVEVSKAITYNLFWLKMISKLFTVIYKFLGNNIVTYLLIEFWGFTCLPNVEINQLIISNFETAA